MTLKDVLSGIIRDAAVELFHDGNFIAVNAVVNGLDDGNPLPPSNFLD